MGPLTASTSYFILIIGERGNVCTCGVRHTLSQTTMVAESLVTQVSFFARLKGKFRYFEDIKMC